MADKNFTVGLNKITLQGHVIRALIFLTLGVVIMRLFVDDFDLKNVIGMLKFIMIWELALSFISKQLKPYHIRSAAAYTIIALMLIVAQYGPVLLHHYKVL